MAVVQEQQSLGFPLNIWVLGIFIWISIRIFIGIYCSRNSNTQLLRIFYCSGNLSYESRRVLKSFFDLSSNFLLTSEWTSYESPEIRSDVVFLLPVIVPKLVWLVGLVGLVGLFFIWVTRGLGHLSAEYSIWVFRDLVHLTDNLFIRFNRGPVNVTK